MPSLTSEKINEFDKSSPIVRYVTKRPVSVTPILISFGFPFVVEFFFGFFPPRKVSRLDPIVALRAE
jgi:putative ABC transport system permease protein